MQFCACFAVNRVWKFHKNVLKKDIHRYCFVVYFKHHPHYYKVYSRIGVQSCLTSHREKLQSVLQYRCIFDKPPPPKYQNQPTKYPRWRILAPRGARRSPIDSSKQLSRTQKNLKPLFNRDRSSRCIALYIYLISTVEYRTIYSLSR